MLLLTTTSSLVQIVTTNTAAVKVHASWVDLNGSTVTPSSLNTAIASATTTTVVTSPGSSTSRNVKMLNIENADGSTTANVTIKHTDGTTLVTLWGPGTLAPGDRITLDATGNFIQQSVVSGFVGATGPTGPTGPKGDTGVGAPITGSATLNFGSQPGTQRAVVTVTGQTSILTGSTINAYLMGDTTSDHNAYEHEMVEMSLRCGNIVAGVGFDIVGTSSWQPHGAFTVRWAWV